MLTLRSTNPKMSWVISKNPETQQNSKETFHRPCRKGVIHGWFADEQTFKMLFVDHPSEISFSNQEFEYLDKSRYCSPYLPVAAISELLSSAMNKKSPYDTEGFEHSFTVIVRTKSAISANRLGSHLPLDFEMKQIGEGYLYEVCFSTTKGIHELLNAVSVWCLIQSVASSELYIPMDEASCKKYAKALNAVKAPYYARHVLIRSSIKSPKAFEAIRELIENGEFKLHFGDTQSHRFQGISPLLEGGPVLYDIGCGELYYTRALAKRYQTIHAFDADEIIQSKNKRRIEKYAIEDVVTLHGAATPENLEIEPEAHVLLTEVIEHMPIEQSKKLLEALAEQPFAKLVISVPNKSFNPHYLLAPDQSRHWDHHWEPTQEEITELLQSVFPKAKFTLTIGGLGDAVAGVHASTIAVIAPISN